MPALALDPAFGAGGLVTTPRGPGDNDDVSFHDLAPLPGGGVLGVGRNNEATGFVVAKVRADGTLDPAFGAGGVATVPFDTFAVGVAAAPLPDGGVLVAGNLQHPGDPYGFTGDLALARLDAGGNLDPSFGAGGTRVVDIGPVDQLAGMVAAPGGGVVLVGTSVAPAGVSRILTRADAAGAVDPAFGVGGTAAITAPFRPQSVMPAAGGKVLVGGGNGVARFDLATGALDPTFNPAGGGLARVDFGAGTDSRSTFEGLTVQPDGRVVVVGGRRGPDGTDLIAVARLNPDGTPDAGFGTGGVTMTDLGGHEYGRTALVQPDGSILVTFGMSDRLGMVKLTAAGAVDATFGDGGEARFDVGQPGGVYPGRAVQLPDGRIVVAGNSTTGQFIALADDGADDPPPPVTPAGPSADPFAGAGVPVRAATADIDGDGVADTVFVTGPGVPLRAAAVSGRDGTLLAGPFDPFGDGFAGGGYVAAGDLDGDGRAEWVVTPDRGGGPRVSAFSLTDGKPIVLANFFGFDDPRFRGGARVAAGDVNADGAADLVVTAGPGGGPRVAVFDGRTVGGGPARLVNDFFALPENLRDGAYIAVADADADGFADLVFGAGAGGAPHVLTVGGRQLLAAGAGAVADPLGSFFAGDPADRGGVVVRTADVDRDGTVEVVVAGGPVVVTCYAAPALLAADPEAVRELTPEAALAAGIHVG
ncbi:MAG: hypothetical protein K2X87_25775 [Gemmataceae bacterium]|nr:hypothetical protein [Gemmataceae bacterium]